MAAVSLLNVAVRNNPAPFTSPYEFEITFECLEKLDKDLEWKLTYVGSATSSEYDQELDSLLVGPIPVGVNNDILGVTVILLTCSYDGREFVRVGYYVNNEYTDEALIAEPPAKAVVEKVRRSILAEKPRVTRFAIKEDDEAAYGAEELEEDEVEVEGEPEVKEGEDAEMAEANPVEQPKEEDEVSDAGSEDIEAESSASEDEDEEEEEGEGEAEGEAADEMETDNAAPATENPQPPQQQGDVMVH
ncbi:unnamed protein product [Aureobasidium mustum]|uniref:Histone chaperone n=1 Tax=Aureobasidium mustum TaxID=2773714 RepID=A0A9N8JC02_9PEZI|nr:unnamed protein product [Aureobasidium mustum]